jgi:hypothetical protein
MREAALEEREAFVSGRRLVPKLPISYSRALFYCCAVLIVSGITSWAYIRRDFLPQGSGRSVRIIARPVDAGDEEKWNKPVLTMYGETVQKRIAAKQILSEGRNLPGPM